MLLQFFGVIFACNNVQALLPARLQRDHFREGITNPSLADAVKAAVTVSRKLLNTDEHNADVSMLLTLKFGYSDFSFVPCYCEVELKVVAQSLLDVVKTSDTSQTTCTPFH